MKPCEFPVVFVSAHFMERMRERIGGGAVLRDAPRHVLIRIAHGMFHASKPWGGQFGGDISRLVTCNLDGEPYVIIARRNDPDSGHDPRGVRLTTLLTLDQATANLQTFHRPIEARKRGAA